MFTPLRIAVVTHRLVRGDGQGRVNLEVARTLLEKGHTLALIATEVDHELAAHGNVSWQRIDVAGWPSELIRNQVFASRSAAALDNLGEGYFRIVNGAITRRDSDINAVHMVHSAWRSSPYHSSRGKTNPAAMYQRLYTFVNARWERRAFKRSRHLVAVSDLLGDQIADLGIEREKIVVIPNGVDVAEFYPGEESRVELGLPDNVFLSLFAGDIRRPLKNLDTILAAQQEYPEMHLAVAGDPEASVYPEMVQRMGLADRVHFLGYRTDLPRLMRASDLFVFPSRYESFSLVLLEAMATGMPVVTASTVGAASLVGEAGIVLTDPDDTRALVDACRAFGDDPQRRQRAGRAGREIALNCSFDRMATAYAELIESTALDNHRVTDRERQ